MPISALVIQSAEGTFGIVPAQITRYYVLRAEDASTLVVETVNQSTYVRCPNSTVAIQKHQALLAGLTSGSGTLTLTDLPTTTTTSTTAPPTEQTEETTQFN